jgi:hypothetical protein
MLLSTYSASIFGLRMRVWKRDFTALITGYNTDVECDGIVYHIQTEDKGVEHPLILSLVYLEGAILASKRSPYDDLVIGGFDEEILTQRLQRQHKLICAAVRAGRIDDLKRLNERESHAKTTIEPNSAADESSALAEDPIPSDTPAMAVEQASREEESSMVSEPLSTGADEEEALQVALLEEMELRAGQSVTLRVIVSRASRNAREPVPRARVTLKTLGTNFQPESTISTTDDDGIALLFALLPKFTTGRAAILIRVEADGEIAELRRIILPA